MGSNKEKTHTKWQKYKHCKTTANYGVYKKARNLVISELKKGKYLYEKDLAAKIKTYNKLFWGYVRSKSKMISTVSKLMNEEGKVSESHQETACILNIFCKCFWKRGRWGTTRIHVWNYSQPLESLIFTEDQVSKAIDHIMSSNLTDLTISTQHWSKKQNQP